MNTCAPSAVAPRLLALDTTTQRMVVALAVGDATHGLDEEGGARASARLLPAVQALLQSAGVALRDLDAVAFARGPGAFTGLRTAASAAQGLAFGLGCPVLAIDSLLVVAEDARMQCAVGAGIDVVPDVADLPEGARVAVAMDARMGEIYAACYRWSAGTWHEDEPASLTEPEALAAHWRDRVPMVVAGTALDVHSPRLVVPAATRTVRTMRHAPAALAALARRAWLEGRGVHARDAQPVYVRDKVAFTTREREASRMSQEGAREATRASQEVERETSGARPDAADLVHPAPTSEAS